MSPRTWLLLGGGLVSMVGDRFAVIAYALLAAERGRPGFLSAIFAAEMVPTLLLALVGGVVTDLFLRRWMWPAILLVLAGCFAAMALRPSEVVIVTLVAVVNTCAALIGPVGAAAARRSVAAEAVAELTRWQAVSQGVATGVGVLLGAVTFSLASISAMFLVNAVSFVVLAIVGAVAIRGLDLGGPRSSQRMHGEALRGFVLLFGPEAFGVVGVALILCVITGTSLGGVVEVFLFRRVLHASPVVYGVAFAAWALGLTLAPLLAPRLRFGWRVVLPVSAILMGVALGLPVLTGSAAASILGYLVGGLANGAFNREATTVLYSVADVHEVGRASAAFGLLATACALLGYLAGALPGEAHTRAMVLASGVAPALAGGVALLIFGGRRRSVLGG
jgi:hypothetical protein